jgi:uncharacterized small protein (DUF1192 family)
MSSTAPARATSERLLTPKDNETLLQHTTRSTKNFFISVFGCIQTSDEKAKIRFHQYQIESRKKAFGVEYVNLLKTKASQADLDACVQKCVKDIDRIDEDIAALNAEIEKVTGETKKKIIQAPAKAPAPATTTSSVPASESSTAAVAAPAPADSLAESLPPPKTDISAPVAAADPAPSASAPSQT